MEWKKIWIDLRAIKYDPAKLYLRQLENTLDLTKWINDGIDEGEINAGGIQSLNSLTNNTQTFATGTTGTNFGITSSGSTHTFNLPVASASNTGKLSSADWTTFNAKLGDANNGLTPTLLKEVQLGGALTQNTTISGSFNLNFTNSKVGIGTSSPSVRLDVRETFATNIEVAKFGVSITASDVKIIYGSTNDFVNFQIGNNFILARNGGGDPSITTTSNLQVYAASLFVRNPLTDSGILSLLSANSGSGNLGAYNNGPSTLNIGNTYDSGGLYNNRQTTLFRNCVTLMADTNITTLNANAILELTSTTRAFILPRMTTTQKNAITAANGMLVYDTTTGKFCGYNGSWVDLN